MKLKKVEIETVSVFIRVYYFWLRKPTYIYELPMKCWFSLWIKQHCCYTLERVHHALDTYFGSKNLNLLSSDSEFISNFVNTYKVNDTYVMYVHNERYSLTSSFPSQLNYTLMKKIWCTKVVNKKKRIVLRLRHHYIHV